MDFSTAAEAQEALKMDRKQIESRPMYVSEYKPHDKGQRSEFRFGTGLEKNKIFVNNVHYDATEEQLKALVIYCFFFSKLFANFSAEGCNHLYCSN